MVLLPTLCPDCNGFTMKVVKYGLDDSYEAPMYDLWPPAAGTRFRLSSGL